MQDGSFYCYIPSGHQVPSWLPFCKGSEKAVLKRLGSLQERCEGILSPPGKSPSAAGWTSKRSLSSNAQDIDSHILLPGIGISAQYGWVEFAGELYRMQPTVYTTKDAVIVLYGFVYDTEVLHPSVWAGAMGGGTLDNCNRGGNSLDNHRGHLDSFEDQGMAEWVGNADAGAGTAQLILAHVLRATRDGGRLSEVVADIQGCYSFLIYDSDKRVAYAARDVSGEESMFYFLDAQGCAHFSNLPFELPDYPDTASKWQELRPGCTLRLKPSSKKASKVEIVRHSPMVALPATLSPPQADMSPGVTAWRGVDEANARRDSISDEDEGGEEGTLFRLE